MIRTVYLAITKGCEGCKIMENILNKVYSNNLYTFSVDVRDFKKLPNWIQINVPLEDFPTMIFVEDDTIKYHCKGTMSAKALQKIITDIGFN